ncbi:hypothetical protein SAMN05216417_105231 [Nitrosospira multiformis]|uniref:Uncharacterized protein n=1 Tax=Nitrosospira multiformis TaxID=1231 RepID=A0A1I7GSY6_9PROT|nr:hypothetical protein SAMN05216417_105231 [Nitrosospira multiformis]
MFSLDSRLNPAKTACCLLCFTLNQFSLNFLIENSISVVTVYSQDAAFILHVTVSGIYLDSLITE